MAKDPAKSIMAQLKNQVVTQCKDPKDNRERTFLAKIHYLRFFQERFLYRLGKSTYNKHFYLKGGVNIYAIYQDAIRPTTDIDFAVQNIKNQQAKLVEIIKKVCQQPCEEDFVVFLTENIKSEETGKEDGYSGIRIHLEARLGTHKERFKIDIGFGDVITGAK